MPASSLARKSVNGEQSVVVGVAVIAFNEHGTVIGRRAEQFTLHLNEAKLRLQPDAPLRLAQQIDLKKGEAYLYLAMWDMTSGHIGSIEMPVQVPAAAKLKDAGTRP